MKLVWSENAWEDYLFWQIEDKKILRKVNTLIQSIQRAPYTGIGSPEALKHNWKSYWSRRITREHRLIYKVQDAEIWIAQCRYHY